jgi:hypothetical protein
LNRSGGLKTRAVESKEELVLRKFIITVTEIVRYLAKIVMYLAEILRYLAEKTHKFIYL